MTRIVIYALADPRHPWVVRYVGKTVSPLKARLSAHRSKARNPTNNARKDRWIRELLHEGLEPMIRPLELCSTIQWRSSEKRWIDTCRKLGELVNSTGGGEPGWHGNTGRVHTREARENMSRAHRGKPNGQLGLVRSPETRDKIRKTLKARAKTTEGKLGFSQAWDKRRVFDEFCNP